MTEREELLDLLHRHAVPVPRDFRRLVLSVLRAHGQEREELRTALSVIAIETATEDDECRWCDRPLNGFALDDHLPSCPTIVATRGLNP